MNAIDFDDDDDAPPLLVAAGEADAVPEGLDAQMEDLNLVKVPITIVTGECLSVAISCPALRTNSEKKNT